ncbi:MAG: class I SAM-dependent methyltransferase [Thermoflexibacteraceae bacterium]
MIEKYKEIIRSIEQGSPLSFSSPILTGFSGKKMLNALQRFSQLYKGNTEVCYLEVGVFQGLTLLSVAASTANELLCCGIDNFMHHDKDKKNFNIIQDRIQALALTQVQLLNDDYEEILENLSKHIGNKKVAVYFIDGPHDYRSQMMCLLLIKPFLAPNAVIIVDDANYRHVRQANRDFLVAHPAFKLLYETYTYTHPTNMPEDKKGVAREGWWDGVNILVYDTDNVLAPMLPQTHRPRELYENEHLIHPSGVAEVAPFLLQSFRALMKLNVFTAVKTFGVAVKKYYKGKMSERYAEINTYSDNLSTRMNELR